MNQSKAIYLILHVVKNNASTSFLVNQGFTFEQIAEVTKLAIAKKYLNYQEGKIILTNIGNKKLLSLSKSYKRTNKNEWIKPDVKNKIAKLDKNDIFIPSQHDLKFL